MKEIEIPQEVDEYVDSVDDTSEAEESNEEVKISEEDLLDMAVRKDIETASIDELYYWGESLGLSVSRNLNGLKSMLYSYYGLSPKASEPKKEGSIKIEQAEYSTYYTVKEVDENIAEFEGRVKVVIVDDNSDNDKSNDKTHTVIADKINFNRSENSFSAIGDVEYVSVSPGIPEERVEGESMTFNLDNWRGSILECISEQTKTDKQVGDKAAEVQVLYYVTGELKKSSTEVMGMDDVYIQTVKGSPYFNVSSTDMWMLNSSDYLIFSPFIRIGHVPVLWVPFYYHTENTLYFNPLYGYDNRRGTVFNNTVYLIGNKKSSDEDTQFSFLAYNMKESSNYDMNNMTLVPNEDNTAYSDEYLKFMFDYYSKLGLYLGNSGDLSFFDGNLSLQLDSGIAFSRDIDTLGNVFIDNEESQWNTSYIAETEVPYRYLFEISIDNSYVKFDYKTYSDIYFKSDFYDRGEDFLWVNYFTDKLDEGVEGLSGDSDSSEEDQTVTRSTDNKVTDYSWGLDIVKDLTFAPEILKPYLNSSSLSFKKFEIKYKSKELQDSSNANSDYPNSFFFYPENIDIPLSGSLSGSIFDTTYTKKVTKTDNVDEEQKVEIYIDPLFEIESPLKDIDEGEIDNDDDSKEKTDIIKDIFLIDEVTKRGNLSSRSSESSLISSKLQYSLSSPLAFNLDLEDSEWQEPTDVEYEYNEEKLLIDVVPSGSLDLSFNAINNLFSLTNKLNGEMYYSQYMVIAEQPDLEYYYKKQSSKVNNSLNLSLKPLSLLPWDSHVINFSYLLNQKLYQKLFDEMEEDKPVYKEESAEWNEEMVTSHSITSSYSLKYTNVSSSVSHSRILPPLEEKDKFNTDLTLSFIGINTKFAWGLTYDEALKDEEDEDDPWKFEDITGSLTYKPLEGLNFKVDSSYNVEDFELEKLNGGVTFSGLSLNLNSKFDIKEEWDNDQKKWIKEESEDEVLFLDNIDFSYKYELPKTYLWKNRINMNLSSSLGYTKNFNRVTDSSMDFNLKYSLDIFKFLSLTFNLTSENKAMFIYFPDDREKLGITEEFNMFEDLYKSFNLFNDDDRRLSKFNLKLIDIGLNYKTPDWDFVLSYSAEQKLEDNKYVWSPEYSFFVEWKPLKMVQTKVENKDDKWSAETSPTEN